MFESKRKNCPKAEVIQLTHIKHTCFSGFSYSEKSEKKGMEKWRKID